MDEHRHWMQAALEQARRAAQEKEVPVGAVAVLDGQIIAAAYNLRASRNDPTAHAEILLLQKAAARLENWRLSGVWVYVTLEPCPMCAGALVQARVQGLVYGAPDPKAGAVHSLYNLLQDERLNHRLQVRGGVEKEQCAAILRDFFRRRRQKSPGC